MQIELRPRVEEENVNVKMKDQYGECKILYMNTICKEKFSKLLYYCWI
jgi:hypothetical protein